MDDMDEQTPPGGPTTTAPPSDPGNPDGGPRVSGEQVRDFGRLRRSRSDRYVAGVAGGLGRHLDVDPTVVRVVLAVLTLFGGAGLLVYLAVWLLVPEDGSDRAPIDLSADVAKVLVLGAAVVAALIVLGIPWGGGQWTWIPWPVVVVALLVVWLLTRGRGGREVPPPAAAPQATPASAPTSTPATYDAPASASTATASYADAPPPPTAAMPAWTPPPPPRPRRTGLVLFWPTLALIAVALGVVGLVDVSYDLPVSTYAAVPLTITALALLVGAFRGRPGGLIALGIVLTGALAVTGAADRLSAFGPYSQQVAAPRTADAVQETYLPDSGDFTLDLTGVRDLEELDGRTIAVQMDVGSLAVELPRGLDAEVEGTLRYAGEIRVGDDVLTSGLGTRGGSDRLGQDPDAPTVTLDLEIGTGEADVTHQTRFGADR